jgi:hypothetical protein
VNLFQTIVAVTKIQAVMSPCPILKALTLISYIGSKTIWFTLNPKINFSTAEL